MSSESILNGDFLARDCSARVFAAIPGLYPCCYRGLSTTYVLPAPVTKTQTLYLRAKSKINCVRTGVTRHHRGIITNAWHLCGQRVGDLLQKFNPTVSDKSQLQPAVHSCRVLDLSEGTSGVEAADINGFCDNRRFTVLLRSLQTRALLDNMHANL